MLVFGSEARDRKAYDSKAVEVCLIPTSLCPVLGPEPQDGADHPTFVLWILFPEA